jgi:hypothetical protein
VSYSISSRQSSQTAISGLISVTWFSAFLLLTILKLLKPLIDFFLISIDFICEAAGANSSISSLNFEIVSSSPCTIIETPLVLLSTWPNNPCLIASL